MNEAGAWDLSPDGGPKPENIPDSSKRNVTDPYANVLESGISSALDKPDTQIVTVNIETGETKELGDTVGASREGEYALTKVSPRGDEVVVLKQVGDAPINPDEPLNEYNDTYGDNRLFELEVFDTRGTKSPKSLNNSTEIRTEQNPVIVWSPDGAELAVASYDNSLSHVPNEWLRCVISTASCRQIRGIDDSGTVGYDRLLWYGDHKMIVREVVKPPAKDSVGNCHDQTSSRKWQWRKVSEDGTIELLGQQSSPLPGELYVLKSGNGFIGIVNGSIWMIDGSGAPTVRMTPQSVGKAIAIRQVDQQSVIYQSESPSGEKAFYALDLNTNKVTMLSNPSSPALFAQYEARARCALFFDPANGTRILSESVDAPRESILVENNSFAHDIVPFRSSMFRYRTLDGQIVAAKITFPPRYISDKRYPVIVNVYPAASADGLDYVPAETLTPISSGWGDDDQVLATHGYVVLDPSMPNFHHAPSEDSCKRAGKNEDPYMELSKGVLPAIDKLIDMGIADPDHIGLIGGSNGGFAVYGLVTQTTRFKAAVAQGGVADIISQHEMLAGYERFKSAPDVLQSAQFMEMVEQTDGPPWKNLWGYIRNNPIYYVDRVVTPLMMIQGDTDGFSIQQSEEFFIALKRQSKRAELVRYWGEGHAITNRPDDGWDMWQRIYTWFDKFLKPGGVAKAS